MFWRQGGQVDEGLGLDSCTHFLQLGFAIGLTGVRQVRRELVKISDAVLCTDAFTRGALPMMQLIIGLDVELIGVDRIEQTRQVGLDLVKRCLECASCAVPFSHFLAEARFHPALAL